MVVLVSLESRGQPVFPRFWGCGQIKGVQKRKGKEKTVGELLLAKSSQPKEGNQV